jgi:glutamyl-tRNA synthetase
MLHIGGARTALFNWLLARNLGGKFILRIEDTDRNRFDPNSLSDITKSLEWLGLDWDEGPEKGGEFGPYFQSERKDIYNKYVNELLENGLAYKCFCTTERLDEMRKEQQIAGKGTAYDRRCRDLTEDEVNKLESQGGKFVIRFKMPADGNTNFTDAIRGEISYPNDRQDDFIIMKTDGFPTYHLASVIDDHLMEISHVLRGEEWIPSTPKHVCLYEAFGWEPPVFAHMSLILAPGGGKLSKRHGAAAVAEYRDLGYLPETLVNFLALLGWAVSSDNEIVPIEQLIKEFKLEKMNKTASQFDKEKLDWMNGAYIRQLTLEKLVELAKPRLESAGISWDSEEKLKYVFSLLKERLHLLSEIVDKSYYFFSDEINYNEKAVNKFIKKEGVKENLSDLATLFSEVENSDFKEKTLENIVRKYLEENEKPVKKVMNPLRIAVTGSSASPGIFEVLEAIGKEKVLKRIEFIINCEL